MEGDMAALVEQLDLDHIHTPGTYTASAKGYHSDVTVTVTFDETHITDVVVDSSGETENVGAAAADKLAEQGLLAQMEQAGFVQSSDTLEGLAEKLNLPADTFVATVERYNELCAKGEDEDFGKESSRMLPLENPPYYGCRQGASLLCTLDGLRINTNMQVLDKAGAPIEGLYAAGDCSGGFFAHNYPEYIVGVAVGRTLTEGYLLGGYLAQA